MADKYSHVLANAIIGSGTKQNVPSLNADVTASAAVQRIAAFPTITILSDNTMDQGDGEGTESYPDISSDEASSPFTLVDRSKQKKTQLTIPNEETSKLDSPIDAIGDRSRGSTRTPDTERGSRSRSQRRPGRPRK
ncbi:hypothetical protein quinque_005730 [Culex quinquefasciatus]